MSTTKLLQLFDAWCQKMGQWYDSAHLELFSDGSGSIKYEWHNHPHAEPNQIDFQSINELIAIIK